MGQDNFVVDKFKSMSPVSRWIAIGASAVALLLLPAGLHYAGTIAQKPLAATQAAKTPAPKPAEATAVTSLGRLEPLGEVIKVSAPSAQTGQGIITQLLVKEGDRVTKGQVIAILNSRLRLEATLSKTQEDVNVSQSNLEKVKAGAKQGEIGAQKAEIDRLKSQLQGYRDTYVATRARLEAQLKWEPAAQAGKIASLNAQLAGEKPTQAATIRRLQSQLKNTEVDYKRFQQLYAERAIEATKLDAKRLEVDTIGQQIAEAQSKYNQTVATLNQQIIENKATQNRITSNAQQQLAEAKANYDTSVATTNQQIAAAQATLAKIVEVRPVDVAGAQAELARAQATVRQAQGELADAYIRAPIAGSILKVHSRAGEAPSTTNGIVEMGQTSQMVAVAEVYESDVRKLRVGQSATIKSESGAFSQNLKGTVKYIGLQIGKQDVLNTDPAADSDSRVVEVKIAIDPSDSNTVKGLTNSKVAVSIDTQ
ncbi:HlyD family efflux transporter periplasmic adaptor subunit [Chamaesiphon sp. VAR_69_metabat_338]|uniref:HlyD family efflux transporter periplasmic adaptor subunit n=1 Tax=Chamaesiphon sp. VAR_69_metabat_338 TaxID=2964704 RepID=UPI00286E88A8|nr:HlyD family efflux transporter periplasmic adaptor subunit [Chamaesiphon sp. VAR_69_metabat_338]